MSTSPADSSASNDTTTPDPENRVIRRGPQNKKPTKSTHLLYILVIVALVGGIVFGLVAPDAAKQFAVLGTMFIQLIKMLIPAIIFCTIVVGIGSVRKAATVGKAGGIALIYFIVMSTLALCVGLIVGNLIQPGAGLSIEPDPSVAAQYITEGSEEADGLVGFIQSIIPVTIFSAFTSGSVLQTLFIALLVGFAVQGLGKAGEAVVTGIRYLQGVVFKILNWILWLSPIGAFGAMAGVVGATGMEAVKQLAILMLAFYITCAIFVFGIMGGVLKFGTGLNIFKLVKYLGTEFLLIVATSSSESALPSLMRKLEHAGVRSSTVGIVVPTGYSFNLDGTAIYLTMSALFISDAMHMPLNLGEQIGLLVFMIIASKGAAGVSGAGLATLAAGLQSHRPELLSGVAIIVGIDKFMSEARALTNFAGNAVATFLIGKWTDSVDMDQARRTLDGKDPFVPSEETAH